MSASSSLGTSPASTASAMSLSSIEPKFPPYEEIDWRTMDPKMYIGKDINGNAYPDCLYSAADMNTDGACFARFNSPQKELRFISITSTNTIYNIFSEIRKEMVEETLKNIRSGLMTSPDCFKIKYPLSKLPAGEVLRHKFVLTDSDTKAFYFVSKGKIKEIIERQFASAYNTLDNRPGPCFDSELCMRTTYLLQTSFVSEMQLFKLFFEKFPAEIPLPPDKYVSGTKVLSPLRGIAEGVATEVFLRLRNDNFPMRVTASLIEPACKFEPDCYKKEKEYYEQALSKHQNVNQPPGMGSW